MPPEQLLVLQIVAVILAKTMTFRQPKFSMYVCSFDNFSIVRNKRYPESYPILPIGAIPPILGNPRQWEQEFSNKIPPDFAMQ